MVQQILSISTLQLCRIQTPFNFQLYVFQQCIYLINIDLYKTHVYLLCLKVEVHGKIIVIGKVYQHIYNKYLKISLNKQTNQQNNQMVFYLNIYYPLGIILDKNVDLTRKLICGIMLAEVLVVFMLRLITIMSKNFIPCLNKVENDNIEEEHQKRQEKTIFQFESAANLKQNIQQLKKSAEVSINQHKNSKQQKIGIPQKKVLKNNSKSLINRPRDNKNGNKSNIKKQKIEENNIINQQNSIKQVDKNRQTVKYCQLSQKQQFSQNQNILVNIKNMNICLKQATFFVNLILGHTFIAFSIVYLYFPYFYTALAVILHLILILVLVSIQILVSNQYNIKRILSCIILGFMFIINLGLIIFAIYGISQSNRQYYEYIENL